jgi:hypothetical protein
MLKIKENSLKIVDTDYDNPWLFQSQDISTGAYSERRPGSHSLRASPLSYSMAFWRCAHN